MSQFHPDLLAWADEELRRRAAEDAAVASYEDLCRVKKARGIRRKRAPARLSRATCRVLLAAAEEMREAARWRVAAE